MQKPSGPAARETAETRVRERLARRVALERRPPSPGALTRLRALEDRAALRCRRTPAYRVDLSQLCARLFSAFRLAAGSRCAGFSLCSGRVVCACSPRFFTAAILDLLDAALRAGGTVAAALERRDGCAAVLLRGAGAAPSRLIRSAACAARATGAWIAVRQGRALRLDLLLPLLPADGFPEYPLPTAGEYLYGSVSPLRVRLPQLFAPARSSGAGAPKNPD